MRTGLHQPAVRDRHQFISPMVTALPTDIALKRDDKQVTDSVFTQTDTVVDHGSTVLSDKLVTTKVTIDSSSTQSTSISSSSSSSTHSASSSSSSSSQSSSSSAKSSSTTSSGSSSAHSSSSTISLSSITSSSSGQATSSSTLPTSSIHSTASLSSTIGQTTPSSSSSSAGNSSLASTKAKGPLSTGAIVGIAAGGGAVIILLLIFLIRKRFLRRKERRLNDWLVPDLPSTSTLEKPEPVSPPIVADPVVSRNPSSYSSQRDVRQQYIPPSQAINTRPSQRMAPQPSMRSRPTSYQQQQQPYRNAPPPMAYNNYVPPPPAQMPPAAPPGVYPASLTPSHGSGNSVSFALVRNAFLPSQPDELSIAAGEMVRVLAEYDDGWALCANMRGEQGVVPQECLQRQRAVSPPTVSARGRDDQLAFVSPATQSQGWTSDPRMPQRGGSQSSAAQNPGAMRY